MTRWAVQRVPRSVVQKELEFNRDHLLNSFDKVFEDVLRGLYPDFQKTYGIEPFSKSAFPKVNVIATDTSVEIEAEIAGYNKEDISVQIEDGVLSIVGQVSQSAEQTDKHVYLLRELKRSSFSRSFNLSDQLDTNNIAATFNHGLLKLIIPRKQPVVPESKVTKVTIK